MSEPRSGKEGILINAKQNGTGLRSSPWEQHFRHFARVAENLNRDLREHGPAENRADVPPFLRAARSTARRALSIRARKRTTEKNFCTSLEVRFGSRVSNKQQKEIAISEPNSKTKMRDNAGGLTAARAISAPISGSSAGCPHDPNGDPANLARIAAISNSQNGATGNHVLGGE